MATTNYLTTPYGQVGQQAVSAGLGAAQNALQNVAGNVTPLPEFSSRTGPAQMDYGVQYQDVNPYQTTGQTYEDYQTMLRSPVTQAYEQNLRDIQSQMGATGLTGSRGYGMHDATLAKAGQSYATGLLGADLNAAQMQQSEEQARYAADLAEAQRRQAYGENQFGWDYAQQQQAIDFANQEAARQDAYNMQQMALQEQARLEPYQMGLGLATGAQPTAGAVSSLAQQAADTASAQEAANTAGWMNLLGTGLGAAASTYGDGGWTFSDIGNLFG